MRMLPIRGQRLEQGELERRPSPREIQTRTIAKKFWQECQTQNTKKRIPPLVSLKYI